MDSLLEKELLETLKSLIQNWENEVVEFKEANNDYKKSEIGQYFSAISNEASLKNLRYGWLIFGVRNKDKQIIGSTYRDKNGLEKLKQEISQNTTGRITFIDIFEIYPVINNNKTRVIMFKIPAAAPGTPTGWNNHYFGRNGESLVALTMGKIDEIRGQTRKDWSKQIIEKSSLEMLDKKAIILARNNYRKKTNKAHLNEELKSLSDEEFLTKLKLIINKKLTNAAMVMLGKNEFDYLLDTAPRIMWRLYDSKGDTLDYQEFTIPFIQVVDKVYKKIRNLVYRYMPDQGTLFPEETQQYDERILRELINNCMAHQDYTTGMRIYIDEFEDHIIVSNPGSFLPGDVREVLKPGYTAPYYRNPLLADTMVKFNLIDTASMGIRRIFNIQKKKYFPMPDYDTSVNGKVSVTVYGKVLDMKYAKILFKNPDLDLDTVFLVDRVQKRLSLEKDAIKHLRDLKVIEGRAPNIYLTANIAAIIETESEYIRNKGFDDETYRKWILEYLTQYKKATKAQIKRLLWEKLPDILNNRQKESKIKNLLWVLKKEGRITTDTPNKRIANWVLANPKKDGYFSQ
ncbi:transcriptional regulator [Treponema sp. R8-4-B8]